MHVNWLNGMRYGRPGLTIGARGACAPGPTTTKGPPKYEWFFLRIKMEIDFTFGGKVEFILI